MTLLLLGDWDWVGERRRARVWEGGLFCPRRRRLHRGVVNSIEG